MNRSESWPFMAFFAVALCGATLGVYWPVAGYELVYFDDTKYVIENPHVQRGLTPSTIAWAFTTDRMGTWHPLTWISHAADWSLYGDWPGGHHATSLVLHALNAVLLLLLLRRLTGALWPSVFVAFVFAMHPLNVASVAWVASRKGVLSAFFAFVTVLAYVRYTERPTRWRYLAVTMAFGLGLLAKPVLVTLPLLLLVIDVWPLRRMSWSGRGLGDAKPWREKLPLFVMAMAVSVITYAVRQTGDPVPLLERLAHVPVAYAVYLRELFWPAGLATPYPPSAAPSLGPVLGATAILAAISVAALRFRQERPYLLAGWVWFLVALGPVIGFVQVGAYAMADRWMYLPMIGVLVGVAWWLADSFDSSAAGRALGVAGVVIIALLGAQTRAQVATWENTETLFRHAIDVTAENRTAHYNLGWYFAREGRAAEAEAEYRRAIAIEPGYFPAHHNLALLLWDEGRDDEAAEATCAALRVMGPEEERFREGLEARLGGDRCERD